MQVCMHACKYVPVCIYVNMYVNMHICMHACKCIFKQNNLFSTFIEMSHLWSNGQGYRVITETRQICSNIIKKDRRWAEWLTMHWLAMGHISLSDKLTADHFLAANFREMNRWSEERWAWISPTQPGQAEIAIVINALSKLLLANGVRVSW